MSGPLLILHDSPDFGGHEKMLLTLLPAALSRFSRTIVCLSACNSRFATALTALSPDIELRPWAFTKQRAEPYLGRWRWRYRAAARSAFDAARPATTLLVQGRIENLVVPTQVLPSGARLVSYLPMAHSLRSMGRSALGDGVRWALYRRPTAYIVPAWSVARQLATAGVTAPVTVVPNVVAAAAAIPRDEARRQLGIPADAKIALLLGRLDTRQKGLDLLARAIAREADRLAGWTLLVAGDGPGSAVLAGIRGLQVRLTGWTDRAELFRAAADVVLLPSRWEGVPLVLLEALTAGLPVLASPIDVFAEYLPETNRHDFAGGGLADALARVTAPAAVAAYRVHAATVLPDHDVARSRELFADALGGG